MLDEVVVTAKLEQNIIAPQQLTDSALRQVSALSVADAVRYFSGVSLKDYGGVGGLKTVDIRSMGSHHLGVFYDGIEVGNAQNGIVDLGKFSVENLESIELYNGQKSETFQPAKDFGSAGTLYLRTRTPRFQSGELVHVRAKMRGGSFGLLNPSVAADVKLRDGLSLTMNTEYSQAHGRYHYRYRRNYADGTTAWDTTAVRHNGDVQSLRAEAGIYGAGDWSGGNYRWNMRGYYYQSERGIPGAIVNNVWRNSQRQWDRNAFVQTHAQISVGRRTDIQWNIKYSNDRLHYLNPDTTLMYVDETYLQHELYAGMAARYRIFPIWDVSLALDYQYNRLRTNKPQLASAARHTIMASAATSVNYRWLRVLASVLETHVMDGEQTYNGVTPSVVANFKPLLREDWFLRAFYKMVYRMPTFNDLYYQEMGVSDLKPEQTRQHDLGSEWSHRWSGHGGIRNIQLRLRADGYFNQVRNKIIAVPKGNSQYRWLMTNLGYVEILGAETGFDLTLDMRRDVTLGLHGTYTYQQALDRTDSRDCDPVFGTYGRQIAYIPRHSCSATATLGWRGLNFSYSYIYVGERYTSSANIRENYVQPYYTHDMAISYDWQVKQQHFLLFTVEVNNLFNQQYEVIPNYPMPGINGKASVAYRF